MQAAVGPAQALAATARADEESYRKQVDVVTMATFESGNLDQLDAMLAARSPQDFLDQMSALETISSDYKDVLDTLIAKVGDADRAQSGAAAAVARAQAAADQANQAEQDLAARKRDADTRIAQAEQLLRALSPARAAGPQRPHHRRAARSRAPASAWPLCAPPPRSWASPTSGARPGPAATTARASRPGPSRTRASRIPRSSSQQANVGTPVSWTDLQPGDLVFYYHPVSHVGIYAGNGMFINAPESGDVVRYQKLSSANFSGARRL